MEIRLLAECPHVIPIVADWLFNQFGYLEPDMTLESMENLLMNRLNISGCPTTFVSFEEETLAGTASFIENDLSERPDISPWLADVCIHPSFRGRQHGIQLANAVAEYAKRNNYQKVYLYTADQQTFFKKLGWVEWFVLAHHGTSITIMERVL